MAVFMGAGKPDQMGIRMAAVVAGVCLVRMLWSVLAVFVSVHVCNRIGRGVPGDKLQVGVHRPRRSGGEDNQGQYE